MQPAARTNAPPPSVKIYNAVYSSVQVYECMVRGIAVMRRRNDSFVNATQILKVAGVDKGRRTKILEKEILPGKHEIVQGGYGKYQGTWIPLERGRELALQYGIAPLLSPLFDFTPTQQGMGGLPAHWPAAGLASARQLAGSASYPNMAPIVPGSALRLLNQGRAQGLFTPSTTALIARAGTSPYVQGFIPGYPANIPTMSQAPAQDMLSLKRTRTDSEIDLRKSPSTQNGPSTAGPAPDASTEESSMSLTSAPVDSQTNGGDEPSPSKRARTDPLQSSAPTQELESSLQAAIQSMSQARSFSATPQPHMNGLQRASSSSTLGGSRGANGSSAYPIRFATKPPTTRKADKMEVLKDPKRTAILSAILEGADVETVLGLLKEASNPYPQAGSEPNAPDPDIIVDDLGHTAMHLAASLGQRELVKALIENGADMHRGNYQGESALIRSALAIQTYEGQSFPALLEILHPSLRTIDTAKRSILHHIALSAGVKGRAPSARYYLEATLTWIAQNENASFSALVDLQDEHGDTALNIAARIGNRGIARLLLDVGANRILGNKLGLRPGDFGLEPELASGQKAEDLINSMRTTIPIPVQKSQDVIADLTNMIRKLSADFATEIKSKQDSFDVTNAHVRAATRELAEQRKQIDIWKQRRSELDQVTQKVRNIEKALKTESNFDWTGRTEASGSPVASGSNLAFTSRGAATAMPKDQASKESTPKDVPEEEESAEMGVDEQPLPAEDSLANLVRMRRMKLYQDRMSSVLEKRLESLRGSSAEKEYMSKKIVALCTGIPIDKVEEMVDDLVAALDSESQIVDVGRLYGFMQRVGENR